MKGLVWLKSHRSIQRTKASERLSLRHGHIRSISSQILDLILVVFATICSQTIEVPALHQQTPAIHSDFDPSL